MERIYIGMGSNLAAPQQQLRNAIEALAQLPNTTFVGVSAFYQSDSLLPGQPRYTNAVAALNSTLAPLELLDALPKHLRPSFRIVGIDGQELAAGKDLRALAKQVHAEATAIAASVDIGLEQRGLRSWSFGDLPTTVERTVNGRFITAYPALADDGDSAAVVACTSAEEQATTMWAGTRRS